MGEQRLVGIEFDRRYGPTSARNSEYSNAHEPSPFIVTHSGSEALRSAPSFAAGSKMMNHGFAGS